MTIKVPQCREILLSYLKHSVIRQLSHNDTYVLFRTRLQMLADPARTSLPRASKVMSALVARQLESTTEYSLRANVLDSKSESGRRLDRH
jgi:hypothetical protein